MSTGSWIQDYEALVAAELEASKKLEKDDTVQYIHETESEHENTKGSLAKR